MTGTIRYGKCAGCSKRFCYTYKKGTPRKWCSERCRKKSYDRECTGCGTRIDGTTPSRCSGLCAPCSRDVRREHTREAHIAAIREWVAIYDEPPTMADWNPYFARKVLKDPARAKRAEDEGWPHSMSLIQFFGSWNNAIAAAGFTPRRPGRPGHRNSALELRAA